MLKMSKIFLRRTSQASFETDMKMELKNSTKTSDDKIVSLSFADIDESAVTIKNWMIHTYYQLNIFLMSE